MTHRNDGAPVVNWDDQPLGVESDRVLARRLGVTRQAVQQARESRCVPPCGIESVPKGIDWDDQPLGRMLDTEIAAALGVSPAIVGRQRRKRGIQAWSE